MQPFHFLGACNFAFLHVEKSGNCLPTFDLSPGLAGVVEEDRSAIPAGSLEIEPGSGIMLPEVGPCLSAGPEPAFLFLPEPDAIFAFCGCINPTQLSVIDPFGLFKFLKGSKPRRLGPSISGIPHLCPPGSGRG